MEIRAAVVREKGSFVVEAADLAPPKADEVLVKIVATGLCHTDLAVRDQHIPLPLPAVLGHEGAGIVAEVGAGVTKVVPGDAVVISYAACGRCANCLSGRPAYCDQFVAYNVGARRPDGSCTHHQNGEPLTSSFFGQSSFGTYALASERSVVKVPKDIPLDILGPLGCGIQTGAGAVLNVLKPKAHESIAVFGLGAVGLSAVMGAKIIGCARIVAVDIVESRLNLAKELGATHTVQANKEDAVVAVQNLARGGVDYAVEATGIPAVMTQAFDVLKPSGTVVVLGVAPPGARVSVDASSLLGGKTIKGAIEGDSIPDIFIPQLINYYRRGLFPFDRLIRRYKFSEINKAAADSERGEAIKPVLMMRD